METLHPSIQLAIKVAVSTYTFLYTYFLIY